MRSLCGNFEFESKLRWAARLAVGLMLTWACTGHAQTGEGVITINERVTGNQEQPKVLYIVPWQSAEGPLGLNAPVQSLLGEEVFGHLEKPEHIREVRYLQELRSEAGEPAAR